MKKPILLIAVLLLAACAAAPSTLPPGAVDTAVAKTFAARTAAAPQDTNTPIITNIPTTTATKELTATPLETATPIPEEIVEEWEGVHLGMCADDVLKIHPKSESMSVPENLGTDAEGLIVRWNYPTASLIFKRRWGDDGIYCYRVQEIQLHK
ncbi:MAG: hypothetical protein P8Y03_25780 [Anaerolineales bacterium]|jgi:H+/gluconate symporter-like permease